MDPQVIGVGVAALVLGVGDDDLRAVPADDRDESTDRLVERRLGEARAGSSFAGVSGIPESR